MNETTIHFIQRSGFLVLCIPAKANEDDFNEIPGLIAKKLGFPGTPPLSGVVVDFARNNDFNEATWKELSQRLAMVPGRNTFFLVNVPQGMDKLVCADGGAIQCSVLGTTEEVFAQLQAKRSTLNKAPQAKTRSADDEKLDKLLIETFQAAAIKTLGVQCSTEFKPNEAFLQDSKHKVVHSIAASMGMMSKTVSGSVALGFKEDTFLKIMGKMLGEEYTAITTDVEDGCGELLNIIFGQAKRVFAENGYQFGKTLPTIFVGQALRVRQLTPTPAYILPFESAVGSMYLELGYRRT